jgi:hypothetical protein
VWRDAPAVRAGIPFRIANVRLCTEFLCPMMSTFILVLVWYKNLPYLTMLTFR